MDTRNLNTLWSSLLVTELRRNGLEYFCVSPGSRSAPLTVAVAGQAGIRRVICHDERAAAFHAVGYARATGKPAVLICTSGSAAANYLPAVIEAAQEQVPLLILSADRPPELQETGANQTIRQQNLFGDYLNWRFELPCPSVAIKPALVLTTVDQAVYRAAQAPAGPVHLNCPFREPLAPLAETVPATYGQELADWWAGMTPYTRYQASIRLPVVAELAELVTLLRQTQRGLLAVGRLATAAERAAVVQLVEVLQWPVAADITSGLRLGATTAPVIHYFDQLLLTERWQAGGQPEVVLHLGGEFTSRRFLQLTSHLPATCRHIAVKPHPCRHDPNHVLRWRLEADLVTFCNALVDQVPQKSVSDWVGKLLTQSAQVDQTIASFCEATPVLSEIAVARLISEQLPEGHGLWLASSMPIRDMDMYGSRNGTVVAIGANRGTSGIEGTLAAASGFAAGLQQPVTVLCGDLAFLHDLNSLLLARNSQQPLTIVLINNNGGGIFSFLPIAKFDDVFEPYFATPHQLSFAAAANLFGLKYAAPQTPPAFNEAYRQAVGSGDTTLIEVVTDRQQNHRQHRTLQQQIKAVLSAE